MPLPLVHVVLYEPEIPPNTGNVIRLCANTGAQLHVIEPLGFEPDDAKLRRAGLDYGDWHSVKRYADLDTFINSVKPARLYAFSTRGQRLYTEPQFTRDDALLFGPETRGLPQSVLDCLPPAQRLTLPMVPGNRSLNLSNAVAVAVYEAWRQCGFDGRR